MLYSYFGTDVVGARSKAHEFLDRHSAQGAVIERITPEGYAEESLRDALGSASLFGGEQIFVIDTPSAEKEMFDFVFDNLDIFAESPNTFVLIEEKLLAPQKKKLEKYAEECVEVTATAKQAFNPFALSDAFLRRDKKSLWLLLQDAKENGMPSEQTAGLLFAQIRSLRLAERASSAEEAGLKPFVWSKAKSGLSKFKVGELDSLSSGLVTIYHDGHSGKQDFELALERWVLEL